MRPHGRARVNPTGPRAFAVCDRCGFLYNHVNLSWQHDYRGASLMNTRLLVCKTCLDKPQPQNKPRVLTIDPPVIANARPEQYARGYVSLTTGSPGTIYTLLWSGNNLTWSSDGLTWSSQLITADSILVACSGTLTVTLFTAVTTPSPTTPPMTLGTAGRTVTVQNNGTGVVTIATTGGQTIEGEATYTLAAGSEIAFYSDGANWRTI